MSDLDPTGYLTSTGGGICTRCYQLGLPPLDKVAVRYVGKGEDRINGLMRHNFVLVDLVYCLKCGGRFYDVFVDAEFRPIEELAK